MLNVIKLRLIIDVPQPHPVSRRLSGGRPTASTTGIQRANVREDSLLHATIPRLSLYDHREPFCPGPLSVPAHVTTGSSLTTRPLHTHDASCPHSDWSQSPRVSFTVVATSYADDIIHVYKIDQSAVTLHWITSVNTRGI